MLTEDELVELFRLAPKESFELLLRNIKVREILKELYGRHEAGMKLSYDENFERIFEEVFRFFFRPLEVAVFGSRQLEFLFPFSDILSMFEAQMELFKAYREFLNALYNHFRLISEIYSGHVLPAPQVDLIQKFVEAYSRSMRKHREEVAGIDLTTEYPFLLPKSAFERFEKAVESWEEFSKAFREFRSMMKESYVKGAEAFIRRANEGRFENYQQFASAFFREEEKIFDELLKSENYLKTQGRMLSGLMDYIHNFRMFFEEIAANNPLNTFATLSLVDRAFERIYDLRRRLRELEKRVEKLEGGVGDAGRKD